MTRSLPIRLDPTQRKILEAAATKANTTITEYIRSKAIEAALGDIVDPSLDFDTSNYFGATTSRKA